uniref:Zinc finger-containing ubiquitin peptidase 1 n=1 Tax=Leptobrachium leishanense TaxID=445787 RepID=A0A8C5PJ97_9ANUR
MLICDICTQELSSDEDMKSHLLLAHMEHDASCPLCTLAGLTYDELNFHINTAHVDSLETWSNDENECEVNMQQSANDTKPSDSVTSVKYKDLYRGFCATNINQTKCGDKSQTTGNVSNPSCTSNSDVVVASSSSPIICIPNTARVTEQSVVSEFEYDLGASASVSPCDVDMLPECPFCREVRTSVEELEFHLRTEHADLLDTPTKDNHRKYECPMCSLICATSRILEEHVNLHLEEGNGEGNGYSDMHLAKQLQKEEDELRKAVETQKEKYEFQKLQRQFGLDKSGGFKQQSLQNLERAVVRGRVNPMEFHLQKAQMMETLATGVDDGRTKTSGVLEALCRYYHSSAPEVSRVWLCSHLDHFSNSPGDKGWGCGFRNFQMLLSSLQSNDEFKNVIQDYRAAPCIPKIQSMIENAWKEGFDPQGASHFNGRLQGTKAWIGACEIYCLLTSLGLKCRILDFHKPSSPSGTHPLLFDWILNFYASGPLGRNGRVIRTSKPAIYLQHQGHSRTIVGIEERKNKSYCLLIFDPGCPSEHMRKLLKQNIDGAALRSIRKYVGSLKHKQYQIVAVEEALSAEEKAVHLQKTKTFKAERIP